MTPVTPQYPSLPVGSGGDQIVNIMPSTSPQGAVVIQAGGSAPVRRSTRYYARPITPPSAYADPVSQWRRHKISSPRVRSYSSASRREGEEGDDDEEDDIDDATSFSSMRVVRDQDKPSRRKVSEWRNSVLRRKREQLALAMATGQWDALSPSSRAASLLDEVGNQFKATSTTISANSSVSTRIMPFIPDVLPKSDRNNSYQSGGGVGEVGGRRSQGIKNNGKNESARKTKPSSPFCYFVKNENVDPTVDMITETLSFLNLSTCTSPKASKEETAVNEPLNSPEERQDQTAISGFDSKSAADLLARWTCQEQRQDVLETDVALHASMSDQVEEARRSMAENIARKQRKKSSQRSQVALEVIKLRKELKRLKHIVQTKKNKKEQRDKELLAAAAAAAASSASNGHGLGKMSKITTAVLQDAEQAIISTSESLLDASMIPFTPHKATKVHFTEPLVTQVSYRPYTEPEEIEKLYFIEEELNELEWDRQTVADDQFEVVMTSPADVKINHQKRRLLALHPQESLPHSLSDLSFT